MLPNLSLKSPTRWEWISDLVLLTIFIGIFYAIWIGSHALFTPDEGRYSEIAREMVATGDYVTPRLNGAVFLDKPILYYWLQASAIILFGLKESALRFWPAFLGVIGCVATYLAGRVLFNRRTGILSACILASSPLYYGAAHYANLDLEVAVLISISILFAMCSIQTGRSKLFLPAYLFSGLAFLTKGLIGIFFPASIIGLGIVLLNRWSVLKKCHLVSGILIFAVVTIPWYVLAQKANPQFFHFFFVDQQVSRFLTKGDFNNKTSFWFYLPIVLAGIFPWTLFVVQAMNQKIKNIWQNRTTHAPAVFLLLWIFIIFFFFSMPKSKTVGYILPIFPPIALMIGSYLDGLWKKTESLKWTYISYCVLCMLFFIASLIVPIIKKSVLSPDIVFYVYFSGIVFFASSLIAFYFGYQKKNIQYLFVTLLITAIVFSLTIIASTPAINQKSIKPLALQIKANLSNNDEVVTYYKYYQDLPLYLERRITIVADWQAPDIAQNDNWVRELWYGMPFQDTSEWLISQDTFWKKWNSDKRLFVFLNESYLDEFSEKAKNKIFKIGQHHNILLLSNSPSKNPLPSTVL